MVVPSTIGAWNVRTQMDSAGSDRPQRIIALVGRKLDRYKVETAALSETRLVEEGPECTYSSEIDTVKMDRPCYQNA